MNLYDLTGNGLTKNIALASGAGIDYSATADAGGMSSELLDDYEEGTWTPTVTANNGGSATTYDTAGKYTKVGNCVTISGYIRPTNGTFGTANDWSGSASGLPFTVASGTGVGNVCGVEGAIYQSLGVANVHNTTIEVALNGAPVANTRYWQFSGQYFV